MSILPQLIFQMPLQKSSRQNYVREHSPMLLTLKRVIDFLIIRTYCRQLAHLDNRRICLHIIFHSKWLLVSLSKALVGGDSQGKDYSAKLPNWFVLHIEQQFSLPSGERRWRISKKKQRNVIAYTNYFRNRRIDIKPVSDAGRVSLSEI